MRHSPFFAPVWAITEIVPTTATIVNNPRRTIQCLKVRLIISARFLTDANGNARCTHQPILDIAVCREGMTSALLFRPQLRSIFAVLLLLGAAAAGPAVDGPPVLFA